MSQSVHSDAARMSRLLRAHGPDDPRFIQAAQQWAESRIAREIDKTLASCPPLPAERVDRLAARLRGGAADG